MGLLALLTEDRSPWVRAAVAQRADCPPELLVRLAGGGDSDAEPADERWCEDNEPPPVFA